jgi:hypothetical protein
MKRPYLPFFAFLILLWLTIPFSFIFSTDAIPGWHTTIFPLYFIWRLIVMGALLFVTIGYWLLKKQADRINWTLFAIHFALTIPTVIYLKFPSMFLDVHTANQYELFKLIQFRIELIPIAWTLFIIGQLLFFIYYLRTIRVKHGLMTR